MLQRNCAQADGYEWDKIKTAKGTICYAASMYLKKDGESQPTPTDPQNKVLKDDNTKEVKAQPKTTVKNLKDQFS